MGRPEPCVLFSQTFVHPHLDEYVDEVIFSEPIVITACEFLEQSASSVAQAVTLVGLCWRWIHQRTERVKIEKQEDDYMGDLSQFLPSYVLEPPKMSSSKKISSKKDPLVNPSKSRLKTLNWQERRKLERERKQQEEDEQTLAKVEAPIPQSNIGFKLLKQMGYTPGSALGKQGSGRAEPVGIEIRRSRAGVGLEDPHKEKRKKEEILMNRKRRKEEDLMKEFGSRQKSQWQSKRVIINYNKAKAALDQLENREIVEAQKNEDDAEVEEEEEEEITEEELNDVLMKLRDEFNYCLFCGCQYESSDALLANCPGTNEDDH